MKEFFAVFISKTFNDMEYRIIKPKAERQMILTQISWDKHFLTQLHSIQELHFGVLNFTQSAFDIVIFNKTFQI